MTKTELKQLIRESIAELSQEGSEPNIGFTPDQFKEPYGMNAPYRPTGWGKDPEVGKNVYNVAVWRSWKNNPGHEHELEALVIYSIQANDENEAKEKALQQLNLQNYKVEKVKVKQIDTVTGDHVKQTGDDRIAIATQIGNEYDKFHPGPRQGYREETRVDEVKKVEPKVKSKAELEKELAGLKTKYKGVKIPKNVEAKISKINAELKKKVVPVKPK